MITNRVSTSINVIYSLDRIADNSECTVGSLSNLCCKVRSQMRLLCFVVMLTTWVVATTPLSAQDDDVLRWTPSKSLEFNVVQQTAISPDGSRIAYVVRVPLIEGEQSEYLSHIWLVNSDGTGNTQFTRGKISASGQLFHLMASGWPLLAREAEQREKAKGAHGHKFG